MWARLRAWGMNLVDALLRDGAARRTGARALTALLALLLFGFVKGWVPLVVMAVVGLAFVMGNRLNAQQRLRRAATLPLDDPRQPPDPFGWIGDGLPTASALHQLARAVDAARRDRFVEAHDLLPTIDRKALRPEELRLLEGVRAIVHLGLDAHTRAAELAIVALPSGCEDIDARLGRLMLSRAWQQEGRLASIDAAWAEAGVDREAKGALPRLRKLLSLRVFPDGPAASTMTREEARDLALEARAVGDEQLAHEIEVEAELRAQRAYR